MSKLKQDKAKTKPEELENKVEAPAEVEAEAEVKAEAEIVATKKKVDSVKITSEEISIIADRDLNFSRFKMKKDVKINISKSAFDELCKSISNLEKLREKGVIQIVK
jgi:hypothetical protein